MNTAKKPVVYNSEEYYKAVKDYNGLTELRDGEIIDLASPSRTHQRIIGEIYLSVKQYISQNKGKCEVMISPFDVKLDEYNVVIPDIFIACNPDNFDEQKYNGAPDFIIEVLSTNRSDDLYRKLYLYQNSGVREYWIVDPKYKRTIVYFFEEDDVPQICSFDKNIAVNIYKNNDIKLEINIAELLK
ncbi:MAG: Uma2 family endonuclease [Oscillospiraceae bacterium]